MTRPKKLPSPKTRYVTRQQLLTEMTILARACDASLREMRAEMDRRLGAESVEPYQDVNPMLEAEAATYEGNHLAPTTEEGGE